MKMVSLIKLAKRVNKATKGTICTDTRSKRSTYDQPQNYYNESLLSSPSSGEYFEGGADHDGGGGGCHRTPTGFLAVYVGEERRRFVVPMGYLSHPLFRMMLDKARDEFGFDGHRSGGLSVPCTVAAFQEVLAAVECSNGAFDFRAIVDEFL